MIIVYMLGWYVFDKRDSKWPQWITLIVLFLYLLDVLWITVLRGDHLIRPTMIVIPFYAYYRIIITGWYSYGTHWQYAVVCPIRNIGFSDAKLST